MEDYRDPDVDPLLQEDHTRAAVFPLRYPQFWAHYKTHMGLIWHAEELEFGPDLRDWELLKPGERQFLQQVLAFFATSDTIVSQNLVQRFAREVPIPEVQAFYAVQNLIETVHNETYLKQLETFCPREYDALLAEARTGSSVGRKALWARQWIESSRPFATRLAAFAIIEGVFFSGAFAAIYWLAESGRMKQLTRANDFISRDEGLHVDFACELFRALREKPDEAEIHQMMGQACKLEEQFILDACPVRLLGMNADLMTEHVRAMANRLLAQLGYRPLWPEFLKSPLGFMNRQALPSKSNFFEIIPTEYKATSDEPAAPAISDWWEE